MFKGNMKRLKTHIYSYILCIDSFKPARLVLNLLPWEKNTFMTQFRKMKLEGQEHIFCCWKTLVRWFIFSWPISFPIRGKNV